MGDFVGRCKRCNRLTGDLNINDICGDCSASARMEENDQCYDPHEYDDVDWE